MKNSHFLLLLLFAGMLNTLHAQKKSPALELEDRALNTDEPLYMPYNRIVASAGKVLTYGDPRLENHTLDVTLLPGNTHAVIEDRYGIAILDRAKQEIVQRWTYRNEKSIQYLMSTYSGIKTFVFQNKTYIVWSAAGRENDKGGLVIATWAEGKIGAVEYLPFAPKAPAPGALPNEVEVAFEGGDCFLYLALNGNNQLAKIHFSDRKTVWTVNTGIAPFGVKIAQNKVYVSNWAGPIPTDVNLEKAGIPYGEAYVDPRTGATLKGTVSVFDPATGKQVYEIEVGLHPNAMCLSPDQLTLYVANGNSDDIAVIDTRSDKLINRIPVGIFREGGALVGSTPNGLAIDSLGTTLYVSNGFDHAVAVVQLSAQPQVKGYIPTEAFPSGLLWSNNQLYVTNLEAKGARVLNATSNIKKQFGIGETAFDGAFNSHEQLASFSIIPVPKKSQLKKYSKLVNLQNLSARKAISEKPARRNVAPRPVPERIGEPSVFKHVLYIIKENRTYDQVYGDMPEGRGMPKLCVFGDSVTPNQHRLAREYSLLDNYYVSGKSSAEGHQWASAGIVSDYVEKNCRAWFRSYPHRQYDAMVYTREGYIWNHALDHGKSVRIYGEACYTEFDEKLDWTKIYQKYVNKEPFEFKNTSTISRVRPILSQNFPGYDDAKLNDQMRAEAFIQELQAYEKQSGDQLPELMVMSLPNDHTAGTSPGYPTPRAQVADNDLAVGRIIEALSKSRFWESTVVFISEDDSQAGWDHISAYRTGALVVSPYSKLGKTVKTNYNQISMLRTMEQILGLPPMNTMDATAEPMFDCFTDTLRMVKYQALPNRIPLTELNTSFSMLEGKALFYAQQSVENMQEGIDNGEDDIMNRILWFATKGDVPYPQMSKSEKRNKAK
jgi:YVTN family beta-propeller protein